MLKKCLLYLVFVTGSANAFDFDLSKLGNPDKYTVKDLSIAIYPNAHKNTFEVQQNGKSLIAKSGEDIVVFNSNNQIAIMLQDTNNDGIHDSLSYDIYDEKGNFIGTTSDRNLDGQPDFKLVSNSNGAKSYVWHLNNWYQIHSNRSAPNKNLYRYIVINSKKVTIDINQFPFKIGSP